MPSDPGHVPPGKVTAFDRAQYDNLISWVDSVDQDLNTGLDKPGPGVRLDETLGSGIHPGSTKWTPAVNLTTKATAFGKSAAGSHAQPRQGRGQDVLSQFGRALPPPFSARTEEHTPELPPPLDLL